ncbi:hypothetical protein [Mucilaginibacter panaciglaebae]|uniref:Uncharacterized protein n=1 Tax=Mucilaginibacter panaciglaebae TaxID=502331 RepID=A0ABP7WJ45_9SPHI
MKLVVNLQNSEEERVLLAFLDSLGYEYQTQPETADRTEATVPAEGETTARSWEEIKLDLLNLFN